MYEFNNTDINIAIVENFKNFGIFWSDNEIVRSLAETKDTRVKETIAREIKHLPSDLTHSLMEKYALEEKDIPILLRILLLIFGILCCILIVTLLIRVGGR
jgi:hypothetical protein